MRGAPPPAWAPLWHSRHRWPHRRPRYPRAPTAALGRSRPWVRPPEACLSGREKWGWGGGGRSEGSACEWVRRGPCPSPRAAQPRSAQAGARSRLCSPGTREQGVRPRPGPCTLQGAVPGATVPAGPGRAAGSPPGAAPESHALPCHHPPFNFRLTLPRSRGGQGGLFRGASERHRVPSGARPRRVKRGLSGEALKRCRGWLCGVCLPPSPPRTGRRTKALLPRCWRDGCDTSRTPPGPMPSPRGASGGAAAAAPSRSRQRPAPRSVVSHPAPRSVVSPPARFNRGCWGCGGADRPAPASERRAAGTCSGSLCPGGDGLSVALLPGNTQFGIGGANPPG